TTERAFDTQEVPLPEGHVHVAARLVGRAARDEVCQPTGRVATEQGSLGSAQYFDAVDIEGRKCQTDHLADVDVVDVYRGRALLVIGEVVLHHAANGEADGGRAVRLRQYDRRHRFRDVGGVHHAEVGQIGTAHRGGRSS